MSLFITLPSRPTIPVDDFHSPLPNPQLYRVVRHSSTEVVVEVEVTIAGQVRTFESKVSRGGDLRYEIENWKQAATQLGLPV